MPSSYQDDAIQFCKQLYLKYSGQQHDRIQAEMRKAGWGGWSKQNLYTRGKDENQKIGWIEKYGFDQALKLHLDTLMEEPLTSAQQVFREIDEIRKKIYERLQAAGAHAERDLIYQHRDYTKLSIEALNKIDGAGNTLESFVAMWEKLLEWLPLISPQATRELLAVSEQILARAQEEYGG